MKKSIRKRASDYFWSIDGAITTGLAVIVAFCIVIIITKIVLWAVYF